MLGVGEWQDTICKRLTTAVFGLGVFWWAWRQAAAGFVLVVLGDFRWFWAKNRKNGYVFVLRPPIKRKCECLYGKFSAISMQTIGKRWFCCVGCEGFKKTIFFFENVKIENLTKRVW